MSQTLQHMEPAVDQASFSVSNAVPPVSADANFDEFAYKPIPPLAIVSPLLGVCALSGLISPLGLIFAVFGWGLGFVGLRQIRSADGNLGGVKIAQAGIVASVLLLFGGAGLHAYWYQTEVPEGFQRLSFSSDISKKGFVVEDNEPKAHPDIAKLEGQRVFLKGYMYPEGRPDGLNAFILCRDNGQCCFGGQPKLTDMISVKMDKSLTARYSDGMVSVAGVFRLRDMRQAGNLSPAFELEATHFGPAKTSY